MDPLSVAGSVVGLISAGAELVPMLYNLASGIKDAPYHANAAVAELGDITTVLAQLQKYIDGRAQASIQRLHLITIEHITATLTECVKTYSKLNAILKSLHVDQGLRAWDRAVWLIKKDEVGQLIGRLQNHKATFGLMLNIIQCASMGEAESNMDRLCDMVSEVLQSNKRLALKLRKMENAMSRQDLGLMPAASDIEQATASVEDDPRHSPEPNESKVSNGSAFASRGDAIPGGHTDLERRPSKTSAFEELLHRSRVYRNAAARHSQPSLVDEVGSTLALSICSSLSLGDVSKISVYALPVYANELSNPECYKFTPVLPPVLNAKPLPSQNEDNRAKDGLEANTTPPQPWWKRKRQSRPPQTGPPSQSPPPPPSGPLLVPQLESLSTLELEKGHIFGVALEESIRCASVAISQYGGNGHSYICGYLPLIVPKCGIFLKDIATETKGVFETAGSPKRLQELQRVFDHGLRFGRDLNWSGYTVFDAGTLLLRYLLQLPEPVIPHSHYELFRAPWKEQAEHGHFDRSDDSFRYELLLGDLPALNRHLLLYLLNMLELFVACSHLNNMTSAKLAAVFQPGILSHPDHQPALTSEVRKSQDVLKFLIENASYHLEFHREMKEITSGNPVLRVGIGVLSFKE